MRILISGATGLVGRSLCKKLLELDHSLLVVGRSSEDVFRKTFTYPCDYVSWDSIQPNTIKSVDAVINLAGESIASGRWTKSRKESILNSRVETVNKIYKLFSEAQHWPQVFIGASAIGFYGDTQEQTVNEEAINGSGFLASVCKDWEKSYSQFNNKTRLVVLRLGVVLSPSGGFLSALEPIFSMGIGGKIGNGKQWMSWIHIDDLIAIICLSLNKLQLQGIYNAVSPHPITNKDWTQDFAKALKTIARIPVPQLAFKMIAGEMSELALNSQRVSAEKILKTDYSFQYASLDKALEHLYKWKSHSKDQNFFFDHWINTPIHEVFNFFSDAHNLEQITPPWVNFRIKNMSSKDLKKGTTINYQIKIHGVPQAWQTEITDWTPPHRFTDNQNSGPYSQWTHTHYFNSLKGGTLMTDKVVYRLPMGRLGQLVAGSFVSSDIKKIFDYRAKKITEIFHKKNKNTILSDRNLEI